MMMLTATAFQCVYHFEFCWHYNQGHLRALFRTGPMISCKIFAFWTKVPLNTSKLNLSMRFSNSTLNVSIRIKSWNHVVLISIPIVPSKIFIKNCVNLHLQMKLISSQIIHFCVKIILNNLTLKINVDRNVLQNAIFCSVASKFTA